MITVANGTNTYNGLSTDTKPLLARNGDLFTEIDTGTNYMFDAESGNWTEVDLGGSGGGGGGEAFNTLRSVLARDTTSLVIPEGISTIGDYVFQDYKTLAEIELPNSLRTIGASSFGGCEKLVITELPEGLISIGNYAFAGCTYIRQIKFPKALVSIGKAAFNRCSGIESIELQTGITTIGELAFNLCRNLLQITCYAVTPPTLGTNALASVPNNCAIYVPAESVDAYKSADGWSARADYIQAIQA